MFFWNRLFLTSLVFEKNEHLSVHKKANVTLPYFAVYVYAASNLNKKTLKNNTIRGNSNNKIIQNYLIFIFKETTFWLEFIKADPQ